MQERPRICYYISRLRQGISGSRKSVGNTKAGYCWFQVTTEDFWSQQSSVLFCVMTEIPVSLHSSQALSKRVWPLGNDWCCDRIFFLVTTKTGQGRKILRRDRTFIVVTEVAAS